MKKAIFASIGILSLCLSIQSCKKHEEREVKTNYQTIDIVLDMNKSYQYSFGKLDSDIEITKQSDAYLVSELNDMSETVLFNYMPQTNFVGTDEVQVTLGDEEREGHHGDAHHAPKNPLTHLFGHKKHECGGHHEDKTVYIFKFTVNKPASTEVTAYTTANLK